MENRSIETMVNMARGGSKESFCSLYGMYKDRLYRYALYKLGDPDDAEDAVSDCILAAWQGIEKLRNSKAFSAWIFRILRACCAARIKETVKLRDNLDRIYQTGTQPAADPAMAAELSEALSKLSADEREVVLLSVIGGLTSKEISEITGLTSGAVRSKLSRSLAKMREFLS